MGEGQKLTALIVLFFIFLFLTFVYPFFPFVTDSGAKGLAIGFGVIGAIIVFICILFKVFSALIL